jgi:hypothetical protein
MKARSAPSIAPKEKTAKRQRRRRSESAKATQRNFHAGAGERSHGSLRQEDTKRNWQPKTRELNTLSERRNRSMIRHASRTRNWILSRNTNNTKQDRRIYFSLKFKQCYKTETQSLSSSLPHLIIRNKI